MAAQTKSFESNRKSSHSVVSPERWLAARKELLKKEKELTKLQDELAEARRDLPWVEVTKQYVFDGPAGKHALGDLFQGKSQLLLYHFMFGPEWKEGCPSCSFVSDHVDGMLPHLAARDVAYTAVSRASVEQIEAFKKRMGWQFPWVSSMNNEFNWDFHVSFTKQQMASGSVYYNYKDQQWPSDEAPGVSVFLKEGDRIFHTYSSFGRGAEVLLGTYRLLDLVPKGRDEEGLPYPMAWVRHHDRYEGAQKAGHCCSE
jgi:predicted dithiol-disulfide oxidoreductase (DUF899 family)